MEILNEDFINNLPSHYAELYPFADENIEENSQGIALVAERIKTMLFPRTGGVWGYITRLFQWIRWNYHCLTNNLEGRIKKLAEGMLVSEFARDPFIYLFEKKYQDPRVQEQILKISKIFEKNETEVVSIFRKDTPRFSDPIDIQETDDIIHRFPFEKSNRFDKNVLADLLLQKLKKISGDDDNLYKILQVMATQTPFTRSVDIIQTLMPKKEDDPIFYSLIPKTARHSFIKKNENDFTCNYNFSVMNRGYNSEKTEEFGSINAKFTISKQKDETNNWDISFSGFSFQDPDTSKAVEITTEERSESPPSFTLSTASPDNSASTTSPGFPSSDEESDGEVYIPNSMKSIVDSL
jgi:hypothetical protein